MSNIPLSHESRVAVQCHDFTAQAFLINGGSPSAILDQSFPNIQQLSNQERSEVLGILMDKFSPKSEQHVLARPDQQSGPPSKAFNERHDGSQPLSHPGHEAVALFLSSLKPEREFKNVTDLARHVGVTPKTIYLYMRDPKVLRRAQYHTAHRKVEGDVIARREWAGIVQAMIAKAKAGNVAAAKFVAELAWPEGTERREISAEEMFAGFGEGLVPPSPIIED